VLSFLRDDHDQEHDGEQGLAVSPAAPGGR